MQLHVHVHVYNIHVHVHVYNIQLTTCKRKLVDNWDF